MNIKLKRALSSTLAAAVMCICLMAGSLSSVWAATTTWDFTSDTQYEAKIENGSGWVSGTAPLYIDATASGSKFDTLNRAGDAQINSGTVIYVPVSSVLDKVTWSVRSSDPTLTDGGIDTLAGHGLTVSDADPTQLYKKLTAGASGYLYSISSEEILGVTVSGTYTVSNGSTINEIKFTDRSDNTAIYTAELSSSSFSVLLPANTTYRVTCNDIYLAAEDITTGSVDMTADLTFNAITTVPVSGTITSDVSADDFLTALTFTSMTDSSVAYGFTFDAALGTNDTYTVNLPEGSYNTTAVTTNGMTTSNRVDVDSDGVTGEEIYFVSGGFKTTTYNAVKLGQLITDNTDDMVTLSDGFVYNGAQHGIYDGNGSTITITVPSAAKVTATASYRGSFTLSGSTGTTQSASIATVGSTASATYTASAADTITLTITSSSETYIASIVITPVVDYVSTITVPSADYPTLTSAINAISSMNRPEGEAGRVTINLVADIEEQVHVTAPYVTLNGNNHEITWYYGMVCSYYSCDSDGYYNEELFRDKYEKTPAKTAFWGGVVIVDASNFYAKDVTFKNTFNYELTAKEIADGAEFNSNGPSSYASRIGKLRTEYVTDSTPATHYSEKERANALALTSNSDCAEFYNVSILSSQDTLGYNGQHTARAYFKDCTIGGNVDYICGGGKMIFDSCTLELLAYSDRDNRAGYITAAKADNPYLFRDCEVTVHKTGTYSTTAYYGRPWLSTGDDDADVSVIFINTKTNGYIVNNGWAAWGGNFTDITKATGLKEYMNRAGGTGSAIFNSAAYSNDSTKTMSDVEYLSLDDTDYLGDWTPVNYIKGSVEIEGTVVDDSGNIMVYGYVPDETVSSSSFAGFTLSTATPLFDQTVLTSDKVYASINYTEDGETVTLTAPEGYYIVAAAITAGSSTADSSTLYIRGVNGIDSSDLRYNDYLQTSISVSAAQTDITDSETDIQEESGSDTLTVESSATIADIISDNSTSIANIGQLK